MKTFIDWNFFRHQAVARVQLELSRNLADSVILPFSSMDYATKLQSSITNIKDQYETRMGEEDVTFGKRIIEKSTYSFYDLKIETNDNISARGGGGGGYSPQILVGMCRGKLKIWARAPERA